MTTRQKKLAFHMFCFNLWLLNLRRNTRRPTYNSYVTYSPSVKDKFKKYELD